MSGEVLSHVDDTGKARMVDVSNKLRVRRTARAKGRIDLAPGTIELIRANQMKKGDVLAVAKLAGIMAAKQTSSLIPLCHNIEIENVDLSLTIDDAGIAIESAALCTDKTGIEMEALTAVSVAALTVWDMCKAVDHSMKIEGITLVQKTKELIPDTMVVGNNGVQIPREGWFELVSLNVSEKTGTRKHPVDKIRLVEAKGVDGDAHMGVLENRQVSFLGIEDIETASKTACGAYHEKGGTGDFKLVPGDFAENITTKGIVLCNLPIGTKMEIGGALLEVSKIGKECHTGCEIRKLVGDCIMPKRGIFARVLRGGEVSLEDRGHYYIG